MSMNLPWHPPPTNDRKSTPVLVVGGVTLLVMLAAGLMSWFGRGGPDPAGPELSTSPTDRNDDPGNDNWESENFSTRAAAQLARIGALLEGEKASQDQSLSSLVTEDFSCQPLRPRGRQIVFDERVLKVWHSAAALDPQDRQHALEGASGLAHALRAMRQPLVGATQIRSKLKIVRVDVAEDSISTTVLVELRGELREGSFAQSSTWQCLWAAPAADADPRLIWIGLADYEEVTAQLAGKTLLADCTQAVLGANACFREQLLPSSNSWLTRIERFITLQSFGHSGLTVGDFNGDGLDDVYVCQAAGLPNRLFVQNPDGTATDVAAEAGVDWLEPTFSALLVDLDNDGDQDLVLAWVHGLMFMSNDGRGHFRQQFLAPLSNPAYSLAAADYDLDGDLDVYSCVYGSATSRPGELADPIPYHDANNGDANHLWRNDNLKGTWKFTDVTDAVGLGENNSRWSFAAAWEDFDNDGDMDLYVANDYGRNNLYKNEQGRFTDVAATAGVEDGSFGMSVSWGDYNNDGLTDLYVSNMFSGAGNRVTYQRNFKADASEEVKDKYRYMARGNSLFENVGDGTFRDVGVEAGVNMGRWAWASLFVDLDNNGSEDLLVANGYLTNKRPDDL